MATVLNPNSKLSLIFLYKSLLLIPFFLPLFSYSHNCQSLTELHWLLGNWQYKKNEQLFTESWHQVSPLTIEGKGASYQLNTLKSQEALRIVQMEKNWFYIAKVKHNHLPVAFKLSQCGYKHLVFENSQHDFPKRIEYKATKENGLKIIVSAGKQQLIFDYLPES